MDAPLAGIVGNNRLLANVDQQVHQQGRCNWSASDSAEGSGDV